MFFNTMYNVVDTFYAGHFSTEALAALSLTFPIFFLLLAVGLGFSTGATALIGNALGRNDRAEAILTANQSLVLTVFLAAGVMTAGYILSPWLFRLLGASENYLALCLQYIRVILGGSFITLFVFMFNGILNAVGDTRSFRNYLIVATIANIGLDPWFMYGGLGLPAMGIRGIAAATVLVQIGGALYLGRKVLQSGLVSFATPGWHRPQRKMMASLTGQGAPASLNMMTVALGIFIITYFLSWFGQQTIAAYGVATRIEQLVLLPAMGLNTAALALVAQNGGAGRFDRVRSTVQTALAYGSVLMVAGAALVFFGAGPLMRLFTDDQEVVAIGVHYLRIAAFIQHAYVFLFINTSVLQGLKKPAFALWIGLYRQLIMPPLAFYVLIKMFDFGLDGIWWSVFAITWTAAIIAIFYARRQVAKLE
jgi:putative MATE family efflux protein